MFLILKIIKAFILPPTLIFVGLFVSLIGIWKRRRFGKWLLAVVIGVYYLLSIEPMAFVLSRSLTKSVVHASVQELQKGGIIVVLGGGGSISKENNPLLELSGISWKRFWHGIEVFRVLEGKAPLLYVGGSGNPFHPTSVEAELAQKYALAMGLPRDMIWINNTSRDTYENGAAVKSILDTKRPGALTHAVVLITSAAHFPRASRVFEKLGFIVIPAPADWSDAELDLNPLSFFPSAQWISSSSASVHEWLGMLGYWLQGRI